MMRVMRTEMSRRIYFSIELRSWLDESGKADLLGLIIIVIELRVILN